MPLYDCMYLISKDEYSSLHDTNDEHTKLVDSIKGDVNGGQINHIEIGEGGKVVIKPTDIIASSPSSKRNTTSRITSDSSKTSQTVRNASSFSHLTPYPSETQTMNNVDTSDRMQNSSAISASPGTQNQTRVLPNLPQANSFPSTSANNSAISPSSPPSSNNVTSDILIDQNVDVRTASVVPLRDWADVKNDRVTELRKKKRTEREKERAKLLKRLRNQLHGRNNNNNDVNMADNESDEDDEYDEDSDVDMTSIPIPSEQTKNNFVNNDVDMISVPKHSEPAIHSSPVASSPIQTHLDVAAESHSEEEEVEENAFSQNFDPNWGKLRSPSFTKPQEEIFNRIMDDKMQSFPDDNIDPNWGKLSFPPLNDLDNRLLNKIVSDKVEVINKTNPSETKKQRGIKRVHVSHVRDDNVDNILDIDKTKPSEAKKHRGIKRIQVSHARDEDVDQILDLKKINSLKNKKRMSQIVRERLATLRSGSTVRKTAEEEEEEDVTDVSMTERGKKRTHVDPSVSRSFKKIRKLTEREKRTARVKAEQLRRAKFNRGKKKAVSRIKTRKNSQVDTESKYEDERNIPSKSNKQPPKARRRSTAKQLRAAQTRALNRRRSEFEKKRKKARSRGKATKRAVSDTDSSDQEQVRPKIRKSNVEETRVSRGKAKKRGAQSDSSDDEDTGSLPAKIRKTVVYS